MSGDSSDEQKDNFLTGALRRARILPQREAAPATGRGLGDPTLQRLEASYKPPIESQIGQIDRGEAWWRDFAWEEYATKDLPGLGLGFTVYPYVAVWEKIWGAVPTEDYNKYKQYYSVHKDRILPLLINGEPVFLTFEELWNQVAPTHPIETDGFEEVIKLDTDNIKTLSSKKDLKAKKDGVWKPLKLIVRHKYSGKLVRLQQRDGETIVTDNHSILDENFVERSPLASPKLNSVRFIENDIQQTSELVLEDEFYQRTIERKMPKGGIAKVVYRARTPITRQMSGDKLEAFCRFLGAYVAEGSMKYRRRGKAKYLQYHYLEIHNTDKAWLEHIARQIRLFTDSVPQIRSHIKKGTEMFVLYVTNNDLCYLVEKYCGAGAENKTIPSFIYKLEPRFKQAFLDEYSFGDGNRKLLEKGQYSGTSISPKLIAGMTYLFAQLNTIVAYNFNRGNQSYSIIQRTYLNDTYLTPHQDFVDYNDYVYDVEVADTHNFVDGIGFVVLRNTQEPFIRATIDFHTQMTISQGYELDYPLDTVVRDVKAFLDRHDFINLLKIMVKDMLVFGNSYTEVVRTWYCHETGHDLTALRISYETTSADGSTRYWWTDRLDVAAKHDKMYPTHKLENPYGEITRFKPLDPMYMRVRRDAYGTILGYVQYYVFPLVTFLADEMIHLRYMPTSWTYESVYGVSMLRPILFHQELMKNYEQTMGAIMNVFLKPMFLVHVGGPTDALGGADVSTAQYNQVKRYFQTSQPGQSIVIRAASPVDVKPIDPPIDRMQTTAFWLQWLHNMRTYALSVPKFFTDPAGLNRATAQTVEKGYFTFINSNRQSLNSQLETSIMQMVLKSLYGKVADEIIKEYGVPKFIWKPVKEDSLEDKAKTYLPLYASRILTKNEVRKALGFEPLDEEELVEEVGESEPPLGQVGAPGITRAGTPTFGSPDETMASRPPTGMGGGGEYGERQPTPEAELETAADIFGAHKEQEGDLEELADELDELKRTFQRKLEEAENETNQRPKRESL